MTMQQPTLRVAVVMERDRAPNRWEDWRHRLVEVVPDDGSFGADSRVLRDDGRTARFLHPGLEVRLYTDESEGYWLNLESPTPVWFVLWRIDDSDPSRAQPAFVTLSYNEAGRWLDAQEKVDNVPLQSDVVTWLRAFTDAHYRPEPKQRKRPASFMRPEDRR
jgi:hypothetical protein